MAFGDFLKGLRPGRRRAMPARDTVSFPALTRLGQIGSGRRMAIKPTPRNLRYFTRTPYCRRAINAIKQPVAMLDWEIAPAKGIKFNKELARQVAVATKCFTHPNADDSFRSFIEQVIEDILCGAGAVEMQLSGDRSRPLWLYPVDGLTIEVYPGWTGATDEARYAQNVGMGAFTGGGLSIPLRNDELIYLRPNPSTGTPFGYGPVEVAFNSICRLLGVGEFAGNLASNARPSIAIDLGSAANAETVSAFRSYWRNEVEGQGIVPIVGLTEADGVSSKSRGFSVSRLYPDGDGGLYLKWQEFLKAEIATAFDLSPMNLGVERDVNRNTAEVGEDRDRRSALKPMADLIASHLTRDALHGRLGFSQLEFRFLGIDPEDEIALATIYEKLYRNNAITPDEHRARVGMPPMEGPWGRMTSADAQIATQAARAGEVIDPSLEPFRIQPPRDPNQEI